MAKWHGWRVTLGCGHMDLRDVEPRIGQLTMCHTCPLRPRPGGGQQGAARHVVNVEPAEAPQKPDHLGSEHWH